MSLLRKSIPDLIYEGVCYCSVIVKHIYMILPVEKHFHWGFFFPFSLLKSFAGQEQDDKKTNTYTEHFNLKHKT